MEFIEIKRITGFHPRKDRRNQPFFSLFFNFQEYCLTCLLLLAIRQMEGGEGTSEEEELEGIKKGRRRGGG